MAVMTGGVSLARRDILEYAIWGASCFEDDFMALLSAEASRGRPRKATLKKYEAQLERIRLDIGALKAELVSVSQCEKV